MMDARPEMMDLHRRRSVALREQQSTEIQGALVAETKALYSKYGVRPWLLVAPVLVQAPMQMTMFFSLRRLADVFPEVASGGAYWFVNLAATDSTLILPAFAGVTMIAAVELSFRMQQTNTSENQEMQHFMRSVLRGLCLTTPIVASFMPCSVLVYWSTNNVLSLLQTMLTASPQGRRMLGIPQQPPAVTEDPKTP